MKLLVLEDSYVGSRFSGRVQPADLLGNTIHAGQTCELREMPCEKYPRLKVVVTLLASLCLVPLARADLPLDWGYVSGNYGIDASWPDAGKFFPTVEAFCESYGSFRVPKLGLGGAGGVTPASWIMFRGWCYMGWNLGTLASDTYIYNSSIESPFIHYRPEPVVRRLTISSVSETRPKIPGESANQSTATITAMVSSGSAPAPSVSVGFSVEVTPNSGGHEHHDINRPKEKLSAVQGTTDANGEVKLTFTAPEVAGIHTIKATCATCSNTSASREIQVKVPDLVPISPSPPVNADGSYAYALTSVDGIHAGAGRYHKNQYYLTAQARQNLIDLTRSFATAGWGTVALNDASLYWGGRYDINGDWIAPHRGHRDGREIDISFSRAGNPISKIKQKVFYKKFCEEKAVEASFSILHHYVANPHYHVYLEKQRSCHRMEK